MFMWQFVYPVLVVIIGLGLVSVNLNLSFPGVTINSSAYDTPNRVYYGLDPLVGSNATGS
jgi:hypothetical protein